MRLYLFGVILAVTVAGCGERGGGPSGWRPATRDDIQAQLAQLALDAESTPPSDQTQDVRGDFDGDGRIDRAALLVNDKAKTFALFVTRSGRPPVRLTPDQPLSALWNTDLKIAPPGHYVTACSRGLGAEDEPCKPAVDARYPAITLETYESSVQIFAWTGKGFEGQWLSD